MKTLVLALASALCILALRQVFKGRATRYRPSEFERFVFAAAVPDKVEPCDPRLDTLQRECDYA